MSHVKQLVILGRRQFRRFTDKCANLFLPHQRRHFIIGACLTGLFSLSVALIVLNVWRADFNIPFRYAGDSLYYSAVVKTIKETGWLNLNNHLGYPQAFNWNYYPEYSDNLNLFIIKIISLTNPSWGAVLNLFYLFTFFLIGAISYYVLVSLGATGASAFVFSVLYSNLPYHYLRGVDHLLLSAYFSVPLTFILVYKTLKNPKIDLANIICCLIIASTGLYYALFSLFLLFILFIIGAWQEKKKLYSTSIVYCLAIIVMLFINFLPTIRTLVRSGTYSLASNRSLKETEVYALKITDLILPINQHRFWPFKIIAERYENQAFLVNENRTAALGVVGSLGFLISLFYLFRSKKDFLWLLAFFTLSLIFLSVVGGFGEIISLVFLPVLRSYNRTSVYIAFISFITLSLLLKNKSYTLLMLILIIAILDQTSASFIPDYENIRKQYNSDQKFVSQIESVLPPNAPVYQSPDSYFPESPPIPHIGSYDQIRMYLHSQSLFWSYGSTEDRPQLTPDQAKSKGFSGYIIDINWVDAKFPVRPPDIKSEDGRFYFYRL